MPDNEQAQTPKEKIIGATKAAILRRVFLVRNLICVNLLNRLPLFHFTLKPLPEKELPIYEQLKKEGIIDLNYGMISEIKQIEDDMDDINKWKWDAELLAKKLGPYKLSTIHILDEELELFINGNGYVYPDISNILGSEVPEEMKEKGEKGLVLKDKNNNKIKFEIPFPVPIPRVLIYPFPARRIEVLYVFGSATAKDIYANIDTQVSNLTTKVTERIAEWARVEGLSEDEATKKSELVRQRIDIATKAFSDIQKAVELIAKQEEEHKKWLESKKRLFDDLLDLCNKQKAVKMPNMIIKHPYRIVIPEKYNHVGWIKGGKQLEQKVGANLLKENPNRNDILPISFGAVLYGLDITRKSTNTEDKKKILKKFIESEYKYIEGWPIEGWLFGGIRKYPKDDKEEEMKWEEIKWENIKKLKLGNIKREYEVNDIPVIKITKLTEVIDWNLYTTEVNKIRSFEEEDANKIYLTEVAPGLDECGWPLEVDDGSINKKGMILKDYWRQELGKNGEYRDPVDKPNTIRYIPDNLYNDWTVECDPFDILTWRNNELDAYRDDYRDGRYHPYSRTHYDYNLYIAEHNGRVNDKEVTNIIKVDKNEEVTSKGNRMISSASWVTKKDGEPDIPYTGGVRELKKGESLWIRRPSDKIPAFDLNAKKTRKNEEGLKMLWKHIGRLYYWAEPDWTMIWWQRGHEDEKGNKVGGNLGAQSAHIATRGLAKYIVHRVMHSTMVLDDAKNLFKEKSIDLDYGPRDVNAPMIRNPWGPDSH